MIDQWVVLLEAASLGSPALDLDVLHRLMEEVEDCNPRALHAAGRYAIQLLVMAPCAIEAHAAAVERWRRAVCAVGAPDWSIVRAEVMTLAELDSDCRAAARDRPADGPPAPHPGGGDADALLRTVFQDPVTALPTAELFRAEVEEALRPAQRLGTRHAVVMLHLRLCFPPEPRDAAAVGLVHRLKGILRSRDVVARMERDVFAVLLTDIGTTDAITVAERALATVSALVDNRPFRLRGNAGIALSRTGWDGDRLLAASSVALDAAMRRGDGRWELYGPDIERSGAPAPDAPEAERCPDDH